ncbi:MAG: hypothetical protein AB7N76_34910 [Planctomycetota bacterium]
MISSGTGRFAPPKIQVDCRCGKRYRVDSSKAGKKLRCKKCRSTVVVPGDDKISMRSRKAILEEFGIDPDAAEERYAAKKQQGYACSVCQQSIPEAALKTSYGAGGLTCAVCRKQQRERDKEQERKEQKLERLTTARTSPEAAARKALVMSGLFALGSAGLVHTVFGPAAWISCGVALAVASFGGWQVYRSELS